MPIFSKHIKADVRTLALNVLQEGTKSQANTLMSLGPSYVKDEYLEEASKELQYYIARQEWDQYCQWKKNRNKARAEIEEKYGFDAKHAMHCIRLIRMCQEILTTGKVNVDRTSIDAEELVYIRNGGWPYEKIEQYAEDMDEKMAKLYETTKLQKSPQMGKIKDLLVDTCDRWFRGKL